MFLDGLLVISFQLLFLLTNASENAHELTARSLATKECAFEFWVDIPLTLIIRVVSQGNRHTNVLSPALVTSLKQVNEKIVQISLTNSIYWNAHTFALTESGKLYAFGAGDKGQLGIGPIANQTEKQNPEQVDVDLS